MQKFISALWPHPSPEDHELNKLESTLLENASPLVFLANWFIRISFLKNTNNSIILNHVPFKGDVTLCLNNLESLSPKDVVCQVWLNFASDSKEEDENVNILRQQHQRGRRQTTDKPLAKILSVVPSSS